MLMAKKKGQWQDMGYVLSYFGKSLREFRKRWIGIGPRQFVEISASEKWVL